MTRHTDPTAVRLHRAYVPYSHVRRPQRVSVRQQMYGRDFEPMYADVPQSRVCNLIVMGLFVVIAVLSAVKGFSW